MGRRGAGGMTIAEDREREKREFIAQWVERCGSASQQERLEAGVLDFREVLDEIDEELTLLLWQPLIDEGLRPFERLPEWKFGHLGGEFDHRTTATVRPARRVSPWEWGKYKQANELLDRALERIRASESDDECSVAWSIHHPRVTLRRHETTCSNRLCAGVVLENAGVSVKVHVGPFGFAREFAV